MSVHLLTDFITRALPSPAMVITVAPASFVAALGALGLAGWPKQRAGWPTGFVCVRIEGPAPPNPFSLALGGAAERQSSRHPWQKENAVLILIEHDPQARTLRTASIVNGGNMP